MWGEQAESGVRLTVGHVRGILGTPAPMVEFLLDAPATFIERITSEVRNVEGVQDCSCVWERFSGCALYPRESTHYDDLDILAPSIRPGGQPGLEDPLKSARDCVQEPGGVATFSYGSHVENNGNTTCRRREVALRVFMHADDAHPLETIRIVNEYTLYYT